MPRGRSDPATRTLSAVVDGVFGDDGPLARTVPEFEPRPSQRAMAAAVASAIERGQVLLAEAGTGTGKTIAYLVPAILSGRRVLVSTGTKTLQEQIFSKDLPVLKESLGIPFTATYMKGRGNYLCLHRLDLFRENPMSMAFADADTMAAIGDWAEQTTTGDRAELEDLPEDLSVWSEFAATAESCVGVPARERLLHHADAPEGRRIGHRHRQPPPALRGRVRQAERLR
jgi:ATP-dependent DNA helicase DinG